MLRGERDDWAGHSGYGGRVDRRAIASWLTGSQARKDTPAEASYRARRLGLPEAGPGSVAGFGRRIVALTLDWWLSVLIARGLLGLSPGWVVAVVAVEYIVLLPTLGLTVGMRITGIRVANIFGGLPRWPAVVVRTVLLLLVIPAVVYDRDGRGLHDRAAGTVVVRI